MEAVPCISEEFDRGAGRAAGESMVRRSTAGAMRIVCGWCNQTLGFKESANHEVTTSICGPCLDKLKSEMTVRSIGSQRRLDVGRQAGDRKKYL